MTVGTIHPDGAKIKVHCKPNQDGKYCVEWQTVAMPAPAFDYFKTEAEAMSFRRWFDKCHSYS